MLIFQFIFVNYLLAISLYVSGYFLAKKINSINLLNNISVSCLLGSIVISLAALALNFFLPINVVVGNIFLLIVLILCIKIFLLEKKNIKILLYLLLITLFAVLILSFDNINRPDAGLYHLPYIRIIQENKILLGISNIHFRFGTVSIVQYLSAIYNNSIMPIEVISSPVAVLVSSIFLYFISYFSNNFENNKIKIFIFFVTIYSFYSFNRYSSFGNDALAHLFFFIFIIKIFEINFSNIKINDLGILSLLSVFTFVQKPFMVFILFVPLIIYFKYFLNNLKIFKNVKVVLSIFLVTFWIIKNILVSGCIIYPIHSSCFESLNYTNLKETKEVNINSEAWSKDWPNNKKKLKNISLFNKNFNWIPAWKNNHFKIIIKKFIPFLIFILFSIIFCYIFFKQDKHTINKSNNFKIYAVFMLSLSLLSIWFLKFPLYRYGQSFIALPFIILTYIFFLKIIDYNKLDRFYFNTILIIFLLISIKNINRIYENYDTKNIWPNIYTLSEIRSKNIQNELKPIYQDSNFIYYYSDTECLYNSAPCSNFLKNQITKKKKYGYIIYYP